MPKCRGLYRKPLSQKKIDSLEALGMEIEDVDDLHIVSTFVNFTEIFWAREIHLPQCEVQPVYEVVLVHDGAIDMVTLVGEEITKILETAI